MSSFNSEGADWIRKLKMSTISESFIYSQNFKFMIILDTEIFSCCLHLHKKIDSFNFQVSSYLENILAKS